MDDAQLILIWALAVLLPGPNFLVTAHVAAGRSRVLALWVVFGIVLGTGLWATVSALGLSLLLERMTWLGDLLRLAGAIYLAWLGGRLLWLASQKTQSPDWKSFAHTPVKKKQGAEIRAMVRMGLFTNLTNPKTAAFFTSLMVIFLPEEATLADRIGVIPWLLAVSGSWYSLVAIALSSGPARALFLKARRLLEALIGALLVGFAAKLAAGS